MLKLENVKKAFGENLVLKGINFEFADKGFYALVGDSGCGKTTLLNILSNNDTCSSGKITYNGVDYSNYAQIEEVAMQDFTYIYQDYKLISNLSAGENIRLTGELFLPKGVDLDKKVDEILAKLDLTDKKNSKVYMLSGGEKQRIAIGRSMIKNPRVIFADEPTGNLDLENSIKIFEILQQLSKECLVVVVTHNRELAEKYTDQQIKIYYGELLLSEENAIAKARLEESESKTQVCADATLQNNDFKKVKKNKQSRSLSPKTIVALSGWSLKKKVGKFITFAILLVFFIMLTFTAMTMCHIGSINGNILTANNKKFAKMSFSSDINLDGLSKEMEKLNMPKAIFCPSGLGEYPRHRVWNAETKEDEYPRFNKDNYAKAPILFKTNEVSIEKEMVVLDDMSDIDSVLLFGNLPQKIDEIVISNSRAQEMITRYAPVRNESGEYVNVSTPEEIIGKYFTAGAMYINKMPLKIVGIFDDNVKDEKYNYITEKEWDDLSMDKQEEIGKYYESITDGYYREMFVAHKDLMELQQSLNGSDCFRASMLSLYFALDEDHKYMSFGQCSQVVETMLGVALNDGEIIIGEDVSYDRKIKVGDEISLDIFLGPDKNVIVDNDRKFTVKATVKNIPSFIFSVNDYNEITETLTKAPTRVMTNFRNVKCSDRSAINKLVKALNKTNEKKIILGHWDGLYLNDNDMSKHEVFHISFEGQKFAIGEAKTFAEDLANMLILPFYFFFFFVICMLINGIVGICIENSRKNILTLRSQGVLVKDSFAVYFLQSLYIILAALGIGLVLGFGCVAIYNAAIGSLHGVAKFVPFVALKFTDVLIVFGALILVATLSLFAKLRKLYKGKIRKSFDSLEA
ncbi:MAG: ATP-binding cassette domain-containing protein [Clostridia bacterium]